METGAPAPPGTGPPAPQLTWKSKARGLPTSCSRRMADSPTTVPLKCDCACGGTLGTGWGDRHGGGSERLWAFPCPVHGTRGAVPPHTDKCGGRGCGGAGGTAPALTRSARTGCCTPPAAWPARAAAPPGCFACRGSRSAPPTQQPPWSCRSPVPPPGPPAFPASATADTIPADCCVCTRQSRIRPGNTHVDRSSHTGTSRVSSVIPMASKVMISSACGTGTASCSAQPHRLPGPQKRLGERGTHSPSGSS